MTVPPENARMAQILKIRSTGIHFDGGLDDGSCSRCGHEFELHYAVVTVEDYFHGHQGFPVGGVVICHEPECRCYGTWSVKNTIGTPELPPAAYLDTLRERLHSISES